MKSNLFALFKDRKIMCVNGIIFLAAFLLFQIELIIAKIFLPRFGGSYLVWGACVVFFQGMLLLGYYYSHFIAMKYPLSRYRYFHIALVFLPFLLFPGRPLPSLGPAANLPVVINIFLQLCLSIGLVFFVLSTTSIIFQSWVASSKLPQRTNPYVLYAISNLGSMAALLTYPFLFETFFDLPTQLLIWRFGYALLAVLHLVALKMIPVSDQERKIEKVSNSLDKKQASFWFLLGAASTIMFLSVTNIITYDITPMPLFWIIPLSIYLATFILNFKKDPWCPKWIISGFPVIFGFSVLTYFMMQRPVFPLLIVGLTYWIALFLLCMFCNHKLAAHKPTDTRKLTQFYFIMSAGGFVGGMFITWVVPLISVSMVEYLLGLFLIAVALFMEAEDKRIDVGSLRISLYILLLIAGWPVLFKGYNAIGLFLICNLFYLLYSQFKQKPQALCVSVAIIIVAHSALETLWLDRLYMKKFRNYYGIYKVLEEDGKRMLMHGTTLHGAQFLAQNRKREPIAYYHFSTPIWKLMNSDKFHFSRIGVVGLGTGSLACFVKQGQVIDFFELDPDMYTVATTHFSFLKDCPGKVNHIFGDARLTMAESPEKYYDIIIVDAFSGDAIPEHLLTLEAISGYRRHLKGNGVIIFHISNRFVELQPVLFRNAQQLGAFAAVGSNEIGYKGDALKSMWLGLTWDKEAARKFTEELYWMDFDLTTRWKHIRAWTDKDYNIIPVIKTDALLKQIRDFKPFYWSFQRIGEAEKVNSYISQADRYFNAMNYTAALSYYEKALLLDPHNSDIYESMGQAYVNMNQFEPGILCYQQAIAKNPENRMLYFTLGRAYAHLSQFDLAAKSYQKVLAKKPVLSDVHYHLGIAYLGMGRHKDAIASLRQASILDPNIGYQNVLFNFLSLQPQSLPYYQKQTADHPKDSKAYLALGDAYARLGVFSEAILNYEKALELASDNVQAHLHKAVVYITLGKQDRALEILNKAKQMLPAKGDAQIGAQIDVLMGYCQ